MNKWKCSACGYQFAGETSPEKCPACGAGNDRITDAAGDGRAGREAVQNIAQQDGPEEKGGGEEKKWRCTVCNYIHTGPEPPETCPVCGADASKFVEVIEEEDESGSKGAAGKEQLREKDQADRQNGRTAEKDKQEKAPAAPERQVEEKEEEAKPFGMLGELVIRHHLHPISVHIPNGVLPVALLFVLLAMAIGYTPLETASYFNLIIVLLSMPVVFATGYIAWKRKYRGAMTKLFKTKLVCSAVVTLSTALLVIWRFFDATVVFSWDIGTFVYLAVLGAGLVAAIIAGIMGGRLVFRR